MQHLFFPVPPAATCGEARSTDQTTREAWAGGHQPGPPGCQKVAHRSPYEGNHCELTGLCVLASKCRLRSCVFKATINDTRDFTKESLMQVTETVNIKMDESKIFLCDYCERKHVKLMVFFVDV